MDIIIALTSTLYLFHHHHYTRPSTQSAIVVAAITNSIGQSESCDGNLEHEKNRFRFWFVVKRFINCMLHLNHLSYASVHMYHRFCFVRRTDSAAQINTICKQEML